MEEIKQYYDNNLLLYILLKEDLGYNIYKRFLACSAAYATGVLFIALGLIYAECLSSVKILNYSFCSLAFGIVLIIICFDRKLNCAVEKKYLPENLCKNKKRQRFMCPTKQNTKVAFERLEKDRIEKLSFFLEEKGVTQNEYNHILIDFESKLKASKPRAIGFPVFFALTFSILLDKFYTKLFDIINPNDVTSLFDSTIVITVLHFISLGLVSVLYFSIRNFYAEIKQSEYNSYKKIYALLRKAAPTQRKRSMYFE